MFRKVPRLSISLWLVYQPIVGSKQMSNGTTNSRRILNCLPSPNREKDWHYSIAMAAEGGEKAVGLPPSVDLRDAQWWEIGDQGDHGACVGFATADVLWWHLATIGKMAKSNQTRMSRRFIWMSSKETDESTDYPTTFIEEAGTWIKAALEIIRKFGCVPEPDLPFDPEHSTHKSSGVLLASVKKSHLKLSYPSPTF